MTPPEPNLLKSLDYAVLQQCMHCGMCLPTCPTYDATRRERHSPRGRVALMRDIADGTLPLSRAFGEEMYYCLGCLACQTACPAGVDYVELFETARTEVERQKLLDAPRRRFYRWLTLRQLFMRPRLLHAAGRMLWLYQASGLERLARAVGLTRLLPRHLRDLEPKSPRIRPPFSMARIAQIERPQEGPRSRVGMLTGCMQDLMLSDVNRATVDVLLANGCEVHTPRWQPCCGSLHAHNGDLEAARELARRNIDAFDLNAMDAIVTNAGGCGSHLRRYGHLLADDPAYAERARAWDAKVRDVHEWLVEIDFRPPTAAPWETLSAGASRSQDCRPNAESTACEAVRVTYDDSCHLCHGQKVVSQPRQVLGAIPGVELVPLPEADWCCGSAGIYGITQPEQSAALLTRKLDHLATTGAAVLATANPGCQLQLAQGVAGRQDLAAIKLVHPVQLLAAAYAQEQIANRT
ncbi:MAG: (Fe-S)-binding protein [Pirellulales bacterium]|nr:(Fe-S)-binding protein [Pirellulales bacterium]